MPPNLEQMVSKCQTSNSNLVIYFCFIFRECIHLCHLHTPCLYICINGFTFIPRANQHHAIHDLVFSMHPNEVWGRNKHLLSMKGLWKAVRKALCPHDQMARTSHSIPSVWENNTQPATEIPPAFDSPFDFFLLNDSCPSFSRRGKKKKKKKLFQLDFSTQGWSARKNWLLWLLSGWVMV